MAKGEIAWQSKDIASKFMTGKLKNKSLEVYGIKLPRIVDVLPTELPDIMVNELRVDNLFRLEDGTYALIDYESVYRMLVFSDKVISDADANEIREWIRMTKVGRLIAAEMDEARREGERKALVETEQKIAVRMLRKGQHIEEIAEVMEVLSAEDIEKIAIKEGLLSTV